MGFWDGGSISWTICKQSAPRSIQITTPTPHHSIFTGRMLFLAPNQQCQSIKGTIERERERERVGLAREQKVSKRKLSTCARMSVFFVSDLLFRVFLLQWTLVNCSQVTSCKTSTVDGVTYWVHR